MTPFITIFTPTYNRATLLVRLYHSLLNQTDKNFEWIIVDDGSTDNTIDIINNFKKDNLIKIIYHKQKNQGKHIAVNKGIDLAQGELFFIVDSDDYLPEDNITSINNYYLKIKNNPQIAGLVGKKFNINSTENLIFHENEFISSLFDIRYKFNYSGDMAEIIKTSILKNYYFPHFKGEKFCTEALIWNRISKNYNFLFFDQFIYNCEYQNDGLTSKYWKLILNNPKSSLLYYKELLQFPLTNTQQKEVLKTYNNIATTNGYSKFEKLKDIGLRNFIKIYI